MEESPAEARPTEYKRGVYDSWILSADGFPIIFAVDSKRRSVGKIVLRGITTREGAERLLWAKLDAVDPIPVLQLVKDGPEPEKLSPSVSLACMGKLVTPLRLRPSASHPPHR